jgi:hypothetical protein
MQTIRPIQPARKMWTRRLLIVAAGIGLAALAALWIAGSAPMNYASVGEALVPAADGGYRRDVLAGQPLTKGSEAHYVVVATNRSIAPRRVDYTVLAPPGTEIVSTTLHGRGSHVQYSLDGKTWSKHSPAGTTARVRGVRWTGTTIAPRTSATFEYRLYVTGPVPYHDRVRDLLAWRQAVAKGVALDVAALGALPAAPAVSLPSIHIPGPPVNEEHVTYAPLPDVGPLYGGAPSTPGPLPTDLFKESGPVQYSAPAQGSLPEFMMKPQLGMPFWQLLAIGVGIFLVMLFLLGLGRSPKSGGKSESVLATGSQENPAIWKE